jgi:hypothetical protein
MSRNIPEKLRLQVAASAGFRCEYCLVPAEDSFFGFQVDHIISKKHSGKTQLDNLAFSCPDCNRHKGSDLATILDNSDELIRFYHPRLDLWNEHFEIMYQKKLLSIGQACKIAALDLISFQKELSKRNIYIHYEISDLEKDLKNLKVINGGNNTIIYNSH